MAPSGMERVIVFVFHASAPRQRGLSPRSFKPLEEHPFVVSLCLSALLLCKPPTHCSLQQ